ncbi:unnamed protein product [Closterium sp. NIES-54]
MVTTTTPGGQRVSICTCRRTGRYLATFTRRPGSSLYTLATKPPQVAASAQVSASGLCLPSKPSPALPCLPCVEGRQRAAPHSSSFPLTNAPLQTLHMDVWGPARVTGQGRERYFLLVVDDYTRYTTVFPLRSKGEVPDVLIPWIRTLCLQLRERFGKDLRVLRLHSDRGGEFCSDLLRDFSRGEGILQSFTLPDSPQQNGIAERRIGLVMEVARTSMIHAAAPHFRWPFATGKVGDASVSRVWGSHAFVCDTSVDKLSARAIPYVFLGKSRFTSQFPSTVSSPTALPLPRPRRSSLLPVHPPGSEGAGFGGAESEGAESEGAAPRGAASSRGPSGASPRLSSQQLREWLVRRAHRQSGAPRAGGAGDNGAGGAAVTAGAGGTGGTVATGPGGSRTSGAGAAGACGVGCARAGDPTEPIATGAGGAGVGGPSAEGVGAAGAGVGGTGARAEGAGAVDPCAGERREPASRPVSPVHTARRAPHSRPPVPGTHAMALRPSSVPLRVLLPTPPESSLLEVPDPASDRARAASPIVSRLLATAVTDPSFESATASALVAELLDFSAACRLHYATALVAESVSASPPSVGGECALGTDVLEDRQEDFECLAVVVPHFTSMQLAPRRDPDAPDIPTLRSYVEAITGP